MAAYWMVIVGARLRRTTEKHERFEDAVRDAFGIQPLTGSLAHMNRVTAIEISDYTAQNQAQFVRIANVLWAKHQEKFPEFLEKEWST